MKYTDNSTWRGRYLNQSTIPHYTPIIFILSLLIASICATVPPTSLAETTPPSEKELTSRASQLIEQGGFVITRQGIITAKLHPNRLFTPASILKIATAAASLHILGPTYRFTTSFFQAPQGDLFIKGYGAPFLTSEEIALISSQLIKLRLKPFTKIIIDNSAYSLDKRTAVNGKSSNPYDAKISALSVNFNTINLQVLADGQIRSAEEQTPYLPIMQNFGKGLPPGKHRIAISENSAAIANYAGQLVNALLKKVSPQNNLFNTPPPDIIISEGRTPSSLTPFYIHTSSKSLPQIIEALFLYSNNLIANHLFLTCGTAQFGYPATWEKGSEAMRHFLQTKVGLGHDTFRIVEGSGLSRSNKITPAAMLKIIDFFKPNMDLLPKHRGGRIKSGTLTGVYSYAGYLPNADPFVLMLNQKDNTRDALIRLLTNYHNAPQPSR